MDLIKCVLLFVVVVVTVQAARKEIKEANAEALRLKRQCPCAKPAQVYRRPYVSNPRYESRPYSQPSPYQRPSYEPKKPDYEPVSYDRKPQYAPQPYQRPVAYRPPSYDSDYTPPRYPSGPIPYRPTPYNPQPERPYNQDDQYEPAYKPNPKPVYPQTEYKPGNIEFTFKIYDQSLYLIPNFSSSI